MASRSTRNPVAVIRSNRKGEGIAPMTMMDRRRSAVASSEDEDARLTGMTRSLDRRLLALNLQPIPSVREMTLMKVA